MNSNDLMRQLFFGYINKTIISEKLPHYVVVKL